MNIHLVSHSLESRLQLKDEGDELLSTESLPVNQKKEKHRYTGVRMKGHRPISSSEAAPIKTPKSGKASVNSVPEEDQDLQLSIAKTPRKKQKMQAAKVMLTIISLNVPNRISSMVSFTRTSYKLQILKTEAHPDIQLSRSPRVEVLHLMLYSLSLFFC